MQSERQFAHRWTFQQPDRFHDMEVTLSHLTADDGTRLFVRCYESSDRTDALGSQPTVVILHGIGEHGGRYEHVAERLAQEGLRVVICDLRGHGQSEGIPTHVNRFESYLTDVDTIITHFGLRPERTVLCGHSFGSLIAIRYSQTRPKRIALLVLLSPLLGLSLRIGPVIYFVGRLLSWVAPRVRFRNGIDPNSLTHSQDAMEERRQDPYLKRTVTAGWFFQMKSALRSAWEQAERIGIPVLACQGELDRIVDPTAVEPFLLRVGTHDTTLRLLSQHYHELVHEPDWSETVADVQKWIQERL